MGEISRLGLGTTDPYEMGCGWPDRRKGDRRGIGRSGLAETFEGLSQLRERLGVYSSWLVQEELWES